MSYLFWNYLGGGFVNLLACTSSTVKRIAAFATVSAAFYTTTFNGNCSIKRTIPILDFHGTADSVIPYDGGQKYNATLVSIDNFRQGWVSRNGCQSKPIISHLSKEIDPQQLVEIQTWNMNCKTDGIVIGYKITEGEHSWPRTTLPEKCNGIVSKDDCTTTVFNATSNVIIPFFNQYTL